MSKVLKDHRKYDFQALMNQYFNSVLLDFDNVKEINAIKTAFEIEGDQHKPKQKKQRK